MSSRRRTRALATAIALVVSGCGFKGPLTLPPKPGDVTIRPAPTTATPTTPTTPAGAAQPDTPDPGTTAPAEKPAQPPTDATSTPPPGTSDAPRG